MELAADFEVATGTGLKPPLYRRKGQKPLTRVERNKSAEQEANLRHRYVRGLEALLSTRSGGGTLKLGESLRRVASFRELGVRWTPGRRSALFFSAATNRQRSCPSRATIAWKC